MENHSIVRWLQSLNEQTQLRYELYLKKIIQLHEEHPEFITTVLAVEKFVEIV